MRLVFFLRLLSKVAITYLSLIFKAESNSLICSGTRRVLVSYLGPLCPHRDSKIESTQDFAYQQCDLFKKYI